MTDYHLFWSPEQQCYKLLCVDKIHTEIRVCGGSFFGLVFYADLIHLIFKSEIKILPPQASPD